MLAVRRGGGVGVFCPDPLFWTKAIPGLTRINPNSPDLTMDQTRVLGRKAPIRVGSRLDGAKSLPFPVVGARGGVGVTTFLGLIWLKFPFAPSVNEGFGMFVAVWLRVGDGRQFSMLIRCFDVSGAFRVGVERVHTRSISQYGKVVNPSAGHEAAGRRCAEVILTRCADAPAMRSDVARQGRSEGATSE